MNNPARVARSWIRSRAAFRGLACLLALASAPVHAGFSLAGTVWEQAALAQGHDPLLLYAIALTESARARTSGGIAPWPWTLNDRGKGLYFASHAEASAHLAGATATSTNIDVGIMQINLRWNGHRVTDPQDLLETDTNIWVAAVILREALDSVPNDREMGIGRYHSSSPDKARAYGRKVLQRYRALARFAAFSS